MASQEDDNKIECISNINKQQERTFLNVYKKHEFILNNKSDSFENKIESLIDVWKSIGELNLSQFDLRHVIQIMDWAKLHALNIVLTAEWNSFKATYQSKLLEEIEKAQNELLKLNSAFATRCKKLADVVRNPWEDPVLMNLMKTNDAEIGPEEIEFFCVETAYLVSVRLKKLCESHCEDLALNLVTAFMNCNKLSKTQSFSLNATDTQMWFIFDIYIALLYKFQERQKIVVLLKELTFGEGLQLVNRFAKKRVKISKIWKNCQRVAILAVQMYISQAVVKYTDELKEFLENYLEVYISLCNSDALIHDFSTSIRRISNLADAAGLYVFCAVIQRKAVQKLKPFVIEMYIRALTTDMNELERQKDANEIDKVAAITSRLAAAFCNLADFLDEHVKVARECVLTAFSLEPTKERLSNIEMLAKRSGFVVLDTGQEWKCKLHPPILPSDEITWMCPECGEWMSKPEFNVPIKINMALNEALQNSILGISEALCDDLVVCLSNPRYQILSWFLPWEELHRLCLMYLQDPQATKNIVTELKFVDIDYSIFKGIKREPLDELDGIERGYEQYLDQDFVSDEETSSNSEDSMSQDSRPYSLGSDGAGEGPYLPMLPTLTKSDPNTLKSLRMFRPNLKRAREKEPCDGTPEKLFKADPNNPNIAATHSVDSSKVENKISTNLNKIPPKISAIQYPKPFPKTIAAASSSSSMSKSCDTDFSSKNVRTATLPLLGGQVAKKENTFIQVNKINKRQKQKVSTPPLKNPLVTKKCQQTKMQNKCLKNGLKENINCKLVNHKAQDFRLPSPDLKVHTNPSNPTKFPLVLTIPLSEFRQVHPVLNRDSSKEDVIQGLQPQLIQEQQFKPNLHQSQNLHQTHSLFSQNQVPEQQPVLQPVKNNLQHPAISQSRLLFKTHILNKLALKQMQKEFRNLPTPHKQEQSEMLQTNAPPRMPESSLERLTNPSNISINTQQPNNFSRLLLNPQQTEEIKLENRLSSCVPSLIPLLNLAPSMNQQPQLIKIDSLQQEVIMLSNQDQKQTKTHCIISTQVVNPVSNHENLPSFSYQCLKPIPTKPNLIQLHQETLTSPDTLPNSLIQKPLAKQTSNQNETPVKKQSENCSNQSLISLQKEQAQEHVTQQIPPVKQEPRTLLTLLMPLKVPLLPPLIPTTPLLSPLPKSDISILQSPPPLTLNTPQLTSLLKSNNLSKAPTAVKLNSQISQEQVAVKTNNQTSPMLANPKSISTTQASKPLILNNKMSLTNNANKILQLQVPLQPNRVSMFKFNSQAPPQLPKLDDKTSRAPIISKSTSTFRASTPPNLNSTLQPVCMIVTTKLENPQVSCTLPTTSSQNQELVKELTPKLSNQHQNILEILEKQQPQSNQFTSQPIQSNIQTPLQQEQQLTTSKEKCTPNEQQRHNSSPSVTVQNQNKDGNRPVNPSTHRSLLHNNYYSLLKVPSPCLNSDKLPISQLSPQIINHKSKDHTEQVDLNKNKVIHQHHIVPNHPTQNPSNIEIKSALLDKGAVLVNLNNPTVKLIQEIRQISSQNIVFNKKAFHKVMKTHRRRVYLMQKNSCNSLDIIRSKNYNDDKADVTKTLNVDSKCNNDSIPKADVIFTEDNSKEGANNNCIENQNSNMTAQLKTNGIDCPIIDSGIFTDFSESYPVDLLRQTPNCSALVKKEFLENDDPHEVLPKINLTEKIRTYAKKSKRKILAENKDCVKTPTGVDVLDDCKNVNINSTENLHSTVQNSLTNSKELQIILCRLPSNKKTEGKCAANKEENPSIKQKCDRGKTPPKNSRRRKSLDKSENKVGKAPNLVQNHILSPLQDVNLRVNSQINTKVCCDFNKEEIKTDRGFPDKGNEKKSLLKSLLSNVPGLNDFQMIRPLGVNQVVNVVQVSGGRSAQSVSIQNSQTSTQVTPHIQRIGQPRVNDQKPEHSNSVTSTTQTPTTTSATSRTTTSQPSTLINILSQQIVRPVSNQTNTVRRQGPLINILSQQVLRPSPSLTPKTTVNSITPSTEAIQVKVAVTTEPTILNSTIKTTNSIVKTPTTVTTGQGGTILQFICKSALPKFQQAFGKTVYQTNAEAADSPTTTESSNTETKKTTVTTKTVPVSVQPIQGSVIYSRQVPVGQTISLIPPGGTTRQVFRIATTNPEQISLVKDSVIHSKMSALLAAALQGRPKNADGEIQINCEDVKGTVTRPTLVQGARIVKPVQLQLPANVVRANPQQPNLSSTTLEQLREFDMVYKQIKERSNTSTSETSTNSGDNQEVTPQRISVTYVNQLQKYTQLSPVVVVSSYNNLQPAASPALSVTSQGSSSPCVTPASTPTLPKIATKNSKGKTLKTTTNNTAATKSSPIPKPQQKPQEDEHTTQRIFDILAEYAEQLRNSPDLNNKPAPRRRSNPPTNPSQNSKRKKSSSGVKKTGQSSSSLEMDTDDLTIGSEDSSGGGAVQLSITDDEQSQASASVTTIESNDNASPPSSRPVIFAEGTTCTNQSRNLIIADSSVGEALKMPNTAVIVPGSYIMPVSMMKGGQQIAVVSGGSKILATVPARSGQNMLLFQSFTNQNRKGAISAVKYSTIQPISGISQTLATVSQQPVILPSNSVATAVALGQPLTLKKIGEDRDSNELVLTLTHPKEEPKDNNDIPQPDSSTSISNDSSIDIKTEDSPQSDNSNEKIYQTYQKTVINSVETSVIATTSSTIKQEGDTPCQTIINVNPASNLKESKSCERMQSVLVTACSSNGPMLSHTTPRYRKASDTTRSHTSELPVNKEDFLHNGEKPVSDQKNFRGNAAYYVNKTKKVAAESQKMDSEMQKQAAIERELRLQKSLSEECEDLGVDEPSASDLFPEADLLFDSNHSPSFDQTSQDIIKREAPDVKEEVKETMNLFSDDDNSSSLRADLFEYVEYQPVETALEYQTRQMNGNATETAISGCEDNTLLPKCATMSEVTLNSPISPEMYQEANMHKYKFKYSNRKKGERIKSSEYGGELVTSSEDTIVCTGLTKVNCEGENYKVVHINKMDHVKDEDKCELHCDEDVDSPSGRGARRSVRKLCSCCNGSQDGNLAKKRPHTSRPHTPATPHKKAFLNKKR